MISQEQFKTKPYKHQIKALEKGWDRSSFALFMEMGTGKSKVLLDNITMLARLKKINFAFIIAPKGVYRNWISKEIPEHFSEDIEHECIFWKSNMNQGEKKYWLNFWRNPPQDKFIIFVMNVEAFSTKKGNDFAKLFLIGRSMLIIDESTTIKNPQAKRTKHILSLSKEATYRRILTGSPVTQSPMDLWSQMDFLDPEILDQTSFYAFRTRYAVMISSTAAGGTHKYQKIVKFKNLKELGEKVAPHSYRILKKDCLDLPDKVFQKRIVELTDEQTKAYEMMRRNAIAILNGEAMSAPNVLTQLIRLHQIVCGHMKTDEGNMIELKSNRINELMNILDETSGKVIIWANYINDIKAIEKEIQKEYGFDSCCTYFGETKTEDRQICINKFQDPNSSIRFFIGNTQTGGYGITLTEASTVIYYSNNYDLEKRMQSEDRAHRIGQKNKVNYIDLVAPKTVDEKIIKALRNKVNIAKEISGEELSEWI